MSFLIEHSFHRLQLQTGTSPFLIQCNHIRQYFFFSFLIFPFHEILFQIISIVDMKINFLVILRFGLTGTRVDTDNLFNIFNRVKYPHDISNKLIICEYCYLPLFQVIFNSI